MQRDTHSSPDPLRPAPLRSRCPVNASKPPPWAWLTLFDLQTQTSVQACQHQVMCSQGLPVCLSNTLTHTCTPSSQGPGVSCCQPGAGLLARGFDCRMLGWVGLEPQGARTLAWRQAHSLWPPGQAALSHTSASPSVCGVMTSSVARPLPSLWMGWW
ncbi:unnamed protein product [Rangifer tarandus platyrhynchus]|uniref:Uncharacterized protein n=1 Tax=Rangifer tarandus platyrhynchus TaxID=3082113 RepID=A0AC59YYB0_RANTA